MVEIPRFTDVSNGGIPLLSINAVSIEVEVHPEQEIEKYCFPIYRSLADEIHPAVVPCLRHGYKLLDSVSALQPNIVWYEAVEARTEEASFNSDPSFYGSVELVKAFGWYPVFDVHS